MSKHGWKWRTEQVKKLSVDETILWLRSTRVTPKLARWVYRYYANGPHDWNADHPNTPRALYVIGPALGKLDRWNCKRTGSNPGWIRPFLWRELLRHKADRLGEEIAEFGYIYVSDDREAARLLMDLYEDESAHPYTRGNVLYALLSAPIPNHLRSRFQESVRHALSNQENPYARCTACMLSQRVPAIGSKDIEPLLCDQVGLTPGSNLTVSTYAKDAWEKLIQFEREGDPRVLCDEEC